MFPDDRRTSVGPYGDAAGRLALDGSDEIPSLNLGKSHFGVANCQHSVAFRCICPGERRFGTQAEPGGVGV